VASALLLRRQRTGSAIGWQQAPAAVPGQAAQAPSLRAATRAGAWPLQSVLDSRLLLWISCYSSLGWL